MRTKYKLKKNSDSTRLELAPSRLTIVRGYPQMSQNVVLLYTYHTTTHLTSRNICFEKKTNLYHLSQHEARTGEADPDRVGRAEQCEALPGNGAPRRGPQLEVSRRQLKTWSKPEPSAALVQSLVNPPWIHC